MSATQLALFDAPARFDLAIMRSSARMWPPLAKLVAERLRAAPLTHSAMSAALDWTRGDLLFATLCWLENERLIRSTVAIDATFSLTEDGRRFLVEHIAIGHCGCGVCARQRRDRTIARRGI